MSTRPSLLAFALLLLLVMPARAAFGSDAPATAPDEAIASPAASAHEAVADPQPAAAEAESGRACFASGGDDPLAGLQPEWMKPRAAACSCKDQCRRDRDCKQLCGPLGGECVRVNSCCNECWCFG